jgi:hypothetical protein
MRRYAVTFILGPSTMPIKFHGQERALSSCSEEGFRTTVYPVDLRDSEQLTAFGMPNLHKTVNWSTRSEFMHNSGL